MSVERGAGSGSQKSSLLNVRIAGLLVVLLCVVIYARALNGPLFFDDLPNLVTNILLQIDGREFDDWRSATMNSDAGLLHRPVTMFTFALNYVVEGEFSAFGLKAVNLAIHLLIGFFIYLLLDSLMRSPACEGRGVVGKKRQLIALIAAALWLLHPLHVSSVLYAVQRMALLSALFTVIGLYVFTRYRLRWLRSGASTGEVLAVGLWLLFLSLAATLSKENGVLLPLLAAMIEIVLFRGAGFHKPSRAITIATLMLVTPVIVVGVVLVLAPEWITAGYGIRDFSLEERVLTQGRVLWMYLSLIAFPDITRMGFFHDGLALSTGLLQPLTTLFALIAWAAVFILCFLARERYPLPVFAVLFFLVGHALESSVLPLELVFEHRNYLPSMGICLALSLAVCHVADRLPKVRIGVITVLIVGVWASLLFVRTGVWADERALARFNAVNHPGSTRANFFYGNTLYKEFRESGELRLPDKQRQALLVGARNHLERANAIDPHFLPALVMLYQVDAIYFSALPDRPDWLGDIYTVVQEGPLHASDITALESLVSLSGASVTSVDAGRISQVIETLVERYPSSSKVIGLNYLYLRQNTGIGSEQSRRYLQDALAQRPGDRELTAYYLSDHAANDIAGTYLAAGEWLAYDSRRRDLAVIRRMLDF